MLFKSAPGVDLVVRRASRSPGAAAFSKLPTVSNLENLTVVATRHKLVQVAGLTPQTADRYVHLTEAFSKSRSVRDMEIP